MNVFILCTGRSGSTTIMKACRHIKNFTSGHETRTGKLGYRRIDYPNYHIESDNRLSWFLGRLDKKYGDNAFYVHLKRSREKTVRSYNERWHVRGSIIKAYCTGILLTPLARANKTTRLHICEDYYDAVNENIELFLKDKSKKLEIDLDNIKEDFQQMWNHIGAEGNLPDALAEFDKTYNKNVWEKYQALVNKTPAVYLWRQFKLLTWR